MTKKVLRAAFSITILTALAVSQLPTTGNCQIPLSASFATTCPMPCCHKAMPMPHCPMLKTSAPRDTILTSVPSLENVLLPLMDIGMALMPANSSVSRRIVPIFQTIEQLFLPSAVPVRAPPSDIFTLAA